MASVGRITLAGIKKNDFVVVAGRNVEQIDRSLFSEHLTSPFLFTGVAQLFDQNRSASYLKLVGFFGATRFMPLHSGVALIISFLVK